MAIHGVYRDGVIITAQKFPENQRFLLIPVEEDGFGKVNEEKRALIKHLAGSVPDHGLTLEETRAERLSGQ